MGGLVPLKEDKKTRTLSHVRMQQEGGCLYPGKELSPSPNLTGILLSDFQPPEL